jgi:hypothetical protein
MLRGWHDPLLAAPPVDSFLLRMTASRQQDEKIARGHRGAEVPAVPQLAEQRRRTPQEGPGAADECGAML